MSNNNTTRLGAIRQHVKAMLQKIRGLKDVAKPSTKPKSPSKDDRR